MTMHQTTRRLWTAAAVTAAVTALALPGAAGAQRPLAPVWVTATNTRADRLDARAAAHEQANETRRWGKAAGLRARAAGLRTADDPRGFASLRMAAVLRYGVGQSRAAGDLLERAGDQALARGDVYAAAGAYVDAAYVAAGLRDPARARTLVTKGTLLMHSPLLGAPERALLQRRVAQGAPPLGAALVAAAAPGDGSSTRR
jgi:hypothetical protein